MAYVTGYKRPRPAEYEMPPYGHADYGQYAPPPDYGQMGGPPNVPHNLPPNVPHNMPQHMPHNAPPNIPPPAMQPVPAQPPPPESLRLGSAPDGTMPVVKLRGLPFSCDIESINMFLEVETVDVVLVRRQGRFSGEAFVLLPGMMQCEFAMNKHKAYMGKRYVEVQQSCREDYYRAVAAYVEDWGLNTAPSVSRGGGYRGMPDAEPRQPYGPPGGGHMGGAMGGSGRGPMTERSPGRSRPPQRSERRFDDKDRPGPGPLPATGVLRLRGLPFGVSRDEVAAWFNEAGVLQQPLDLKNVHPVLAYDGRPTGSAFVEFASPADSESAMAKDKANMGSRYVELFHSCKDELLIATSR